MARPSKKAPAAGKDKKQSQTQERLQDGAEASMEEEVLDSLVQAVPSVLIVEGQSEGSVSEIAEAQIEAIPAPDEDEPEGREDEAQDAADIEEAGEESPVLQSEEHARAVIEALLFASSEPLSARRIDNAIGKPGTKYVRERMAELQAERDQDGSGIQISEVAGGFQMGTKPDLAPFILRLLRHKKRNPLTPAALETLAIIAYKQPLIRAEVDAIRGVESSGVIRTLIDLELVESRGQKEVIGRPQLYGTTDKFLRAFGLRNLEDLPSIQELRERFKIGRPK